MTRLHDMTDAELAALLDDPGCYWRSTVARELLRRVGCRVHYHAYYYPVSLPHRQIRYQIQYTWTVDGPPQHREQFHLPVVLTDGADLVQLAREVWCVRYASSRRGGDSVG